MKPEPEKITRWTNQTEPNRKPNFFFFERFRFLTRFVNEHDKKKRKFNLPVYSTYFDTENGNFLY